MDSKLLEKRLKALMLDYKVAVQFGELGRAIGAREEMGKLIVNQFDLIERAMRRYNAPLSEPEDYDDEVPF